MPRFRFDDAPRPALVRRQRPEAVMTLGQPAVVVARDALRRLKRYVSDEVVVVVCPPRLSAYEMARLSALLRAKASQERVVVMDTSIILCS